jgi:Ni2+-binding GTPase involved in maturation of urease and hydrogenase
MPQSRTDHQRRFPTPTRRPAYSVLDSAKLRETFGLQLPGWEESLRLVLLAAGEGEDKPLKYPAMFHSADLVVISKIDLAAAVAFDRPQALRAIATVAPQARVFECSARSGAGLEALLEALLPLRPLPQRL